MELLLREYEKIGRFEGGFSTVWKVRHHQFHNIRAIKELHDPIYDSNSKLYKSFCNESEKLLRLGNGGHPNIVKIFRSVIDNDRAYLEMDFVEGETLHKYLEDKKFIPVNEVMKFVSDIAGALAYCHEDIYLFCMDREIDNLTPDPNDAGKVLIDDKTRHRLIDKYKIWHNDIQSKNVMRKINGNYMLFDFGLAVSDEGEITSSKKKNGICEYMSPEKLDKGVFDARSDVYSFGILLFEVLAGRLPFEIEAENNRDAISEQIKILEKHKYAQPPAIEPLRRAAFEAAHPGETYKKDYPDRLEQMILKCLEKLPENRYATAKEFYTEFEKIRNESPFESGEQIKKLKESNEKILNERNNLSLENTKLNDQVIRLTKRYKKNKLIPGLFVLCLIFAALAIFFGVKSNRSNEKSNSEITQILENDEDISMQPDSLKTRNERIASENDSLGLMSENTDSALSDKQKEIDRLQRENTTFMTNSAADKNTISKLRQENNEKDATIKKMDADIKKKDADIKKKDADIKNKDKKIIDYQEIIKKL